MKTNMETSSNIEDVCVKEQQKTTRSSWINNRKRWAFSYL